MNAASSRETGMAMSGADRSGQPDCSAQPMFHRVLRAQPMIVRDTLTDIRRRFAADIDADALGRLELVLAEVMNNVTEHGMGDTPQGEATGKRAGKGIPLIHLCIVRHEGGLSCAITDDGVSLPEGCLLPRGLPDGGGQDMPEGGFGWFLIQDLTQELCYYREERRNFLAFRVPFSDDQRETGEPRNATASKP